MYVVGQWWTTFQGCQFVVSPCGADLPLMQGIVIVLNHLQRGASLHAMFRQHGPSSQPHGGGGVLSHDRFLRNWPTPLWGRGRTGKPFWMKVQYSCQVLMLWASNHPCSGGGVLGHGQPLRGWPTLHGRRGYSGQPSLGRVHFSCRIWTLSANNQPHDRGMIEVGIGRGWPLWSQLTHHEGSAHDAKPS